MYTASTSSSRRPGAAQPILCPPRPAAPASLPRPSSTSRSTAAKTRSINCSSVGAGEPGVGGRTSPRGNWAGVGGAGETSPCPDAGGTESAFGRRPSSTSCFLLFNCSSVFLHKLSGVAPGCTFVKQRSKNTCCRRLNSRSPVYLVYYAECNSVSSSRIGGLLPA